VWRQISLTHFRSLFCRTEKSLFPWAKEQMEHRFTDYLIFEDDKVKVWFSNVESFKVRVGPLLLLL